MKAGRLGEVKRAAAGVTAASRTVDDEYRALLGEPTFPI